MIPFYNEATTLETLVNKVASIPIRKEIILVDDGSSDGSTEIAQKIAQRLTDQSADQRNSIQIAIHATNMGKGAALKTGLEVATGDVLIVQDADLEYDPEEFPALIKPIIEGQADVVFGSRFLCDRPHQVSYFWHYVGNRAWTRLSNALTNLKLTDMETVEDSSNRILSQRRAPIS